MNTRRLGDSDLDLSEVGFGAWAIGGGGWSFGWGFQDDDEAIAAIRKALELGVNWIDTAALYGLGHSEELVAKAVAGIRDEVIIATKCSLVWNDSGEITTSLAADSIRRECENSLRRLNTDIIDLYQIHWPDDSEHIDDGWEAINKLIDEGKVRYGGVSNFNVAQMERAQKLHPITSLQPPYSILRRRYEREGEFDYCRDHKIGIVAYSPMQCGLLTGSFDIERVAQDDWRRKSGEFQQPNLSINLKFVEELRKIAREYDKTVAQLAIAWVLRLDIVSSAIVGARRPSQIAETVGGAGWVISPEHLDRINELLKDRLTALQAKNGYIPEWERSAEVE